MTALTLTPAARPSTDGSRRLAELVELVRWAPAPLWGRDGASHVRYVAYLAGSMLAWTGVGVGLSAALARLVSLGG